MSKSKKPSVAVLLTVFNRRDSTLKCLSNLYSQKGNDNYSIEVFLTDDGCSDGTPDAIRAQFPNVNIIQGDGSLYWNRGMIAAWEVAKKKCYDYFMLLNDDTDLFCNALEILLNDALCFENSIIVGATLSSDKTKVTYGGRTKYGGLITEWDRSTECDTFNGNVVLIPHAVYESIGTLDPVFHHGIGDSDYGLRATEAGFKCILASECVGICDAHSKLPKWCDPEVSLSKRFRYLYSPGGNGNNPIQYFIFRKRHYGLLAAIKSFVTNHVRALFPTLNKKSADKY